MNPSQQQIDDAFDKLPEVAREYIASLEVFNNLKEIYKKHFLSDEQKETLGGETGLVMMGLIKQQDFAKNIEEKMSLTPEVAKDISLDIQDKIFRNYVKILDSTKAERQIETEQNDIKNVKSVVGGVEIEPPMGPMDLRGEEESGLDKITEETFNKEDVLNVIENPENPNSVKKDSPVNLGSIGNLPYQKLDTALSIPQKTESIIVKTNPTPKPESSQTKPTKTYPTHNDPYREPLE